jgi:hypothetical protein
MHSIETIRRMNKSHFKPYNSKGEYMGKGGCGETSSGLLLDHVVKQKTKIRIINSDNETYITKITKVGGDMGWLCGYVGVPIGHPLFGSDLAGCEEPRVSVHGGVTFAEALDEYEGYWFIGFDTMHFNDPLVTDLLDECKTMTLKKAISKGYWAEHLVAEELNCLLQQIIKLEV